MSGGARNDTFDDLEEMDHSDIKEMRGDLERDLHCLRLCIQTCMIELCQRSQTCSFPETRFEIGLDPFEDSMHIGNCCGSL